MKKIICIFLVLAVSASIFALDIKGTAPTFKANDPNNPFAQQFVEELNYQFDKIFKEAKNEIQEQVKNIDTTPEMFIKAWGDAGIFASHGATERSYGSYKLFTVTLGPMIGFQLPGSPFTIMDEMDNLLEKLNEEHDMKLGINPQLFNARIGINTSKFLLKDLYLGLHFGFMKLNGLVDGFSFNNFSLGLTANYQLVPPVNIAAGLVLWRGLNVGSGIIYQGTKINYALELEPIRKSLDPVIMSGFTASGNLTISPKIILDMNINTFVIPLEAMTAVRLLWFLNIPLGVGVDIGFGKNDLNIGMNSDINAEIKGDISSFVQQDKKGDLSVNAGGDMSPSLFNLKLMTGLGFNFGPVVLDIPITFYIGNGFNFGITLGVVW